MFALDVSPPNPQPVARRGRLALVGVLVVGCAAAGYLGQRSMQASEGTASAAVVEQAAQTEPAYVMDPLLFPSEVTGYRRGKAHAIEVVTLSGVPVEIETARAFLAMRRAAAEAGIELAIESGFRTHAHQAELYRAYRRGHGNKAARPGRSNHQSGRALDLVITSEATLAWLEANAANFAFRRTVRGEPWHWEYVKVPRAGKSKRFARSKKARAKRLARAKARRARIAKRAAKAKNNRKRPSGRRVAER